MKQWLLGLYLLGWGAWPCGAEWSMTMDVTMQKGQPYVPLVMMARSLGLSYQISPEPSSLLFSYSGRQVSISGNMVMLVSEQLIPLSVRPYWQGQELWVPLDAIQKIFYARVNWHVRTQEAVFTVD